jgi:Uma2 family endonuclease
MTFEEFLAWNPESGRAEWVDGEVVLVSPASGDHQFLVIFLVELLAPIIRARGLGLLLTAPFLMRLPNRPSGREPDILFLATEHAARYKQTFLDGPADLVIEIISPDSETRDRADKLREYEEAGIPEYWMFDPVRRDAYFFLLGDDGHYHLAVADKDGIFASRVLSGFRLRVDWLWRRPLPDPVEALRELPA